MSRPKKSSPSQKSFWTTFKEFFIAGFASSLGVLGMFILLGLFSFFFIFIGLLTMGSTKKKDPKTDEERVNWKNPLAYLGFIFIVIGCLPWLPYLFQGMMFSIGNQMAEGVVSSLTGK